MLKKSGLAWFCTKAPQITSRSSMYVGMCWYLGKIRSVRTLVLNASEAVIYLSVILGKALRCVMTDDVKSHVLRVFA